MAQQNGHLTIEQLSAYIDQQLSPEELALCDAHLSTCQQCQQSLAQLRLTVAFVRALPQPTLPRSFVLPASEGRIPSRPDNITPITEARRPRRAPYYVRSVVRAVSTLAAVLGFIFLLSGVIGPILSFHGGASTTGSSSYTPASQGNDVTSTNAAGPRSTPNVHVSATCGKVVQGTCVSSSEEASPTVTPTSTPVSTPTATTGERSGSSGNQPPLSFPLPDLGTPEGRLGTGALLLLLGILGLILVRIMQRRTATR